MEKYLIALSLLGFFCGCNGQENMKTLPPQATDSSNHTSLIPGTKRIPDDPYFVVTNDTFSTYGPKSITRNVLEDSDGNMWFASWEGIIRYDGTTFTNFTLKEGLIQFHVFSLLEDRDGFLWFGTIRGGLYRYDPRADPSSARYDRITAGIKPFTLFTTDDGLANDMVLCMMQDRDGFIWFGTDDGVSRYDPAGKHEEGQPVFMNIIETDGLCGNSVNSITQDSRGRIWFGTRGGEKGDACFYDGTTFTLVSNPLGLRFSNVRMIIEDQKDILWIGGQDGLYRYDPDLVGGISGGAMKAISKDFTGYIFEGKMGDLWLSKGDGQGMSLYKYDGNTSVRIASRVQVFGITEDSHGHIWFGSLEGVERYDGSTIEGFVD